MCEETTPCWLLLYKNPNRYLNLKDESPAKQKSFDIDERSGFIILLTGGGIVVQCDLVVT